jgi:phosphoribosylformylglycinamidine (FGAM) synthase PurS component
LNWGFVFLISIFGFGSGLSGLGKIEFMAHRIEVGFKSNIRDALGEKVRKRIKDDLNMAIAAVRTIEVYTVDMDLGSDELAALAAGPFSDPVIQEYLIDRPLAREFDWLIEVGLRPGAAAQQIPRH